jgi:hypothetical protein
VTLRYVALGRNSLLSGGALGCSRKGAIAGLLSLSSSQYNVTKYEVVDLDELVEQTNEDFFVVMSSRRLMQANMGKGRRSMPSDLRSTRHAPGTPAIKCPALVA